MKLFVKARQAAAVGEMHTWKDGRRYKKTAPGKWKFVAAASRSRMDTEFYDKRAKQHLDSAYRLFKESTGKMSWAGIGIVEHLEEKYGVYDFDDLKELIKKSPRDKASEIYRSTKQYVDSLTIATGLKKAAVDRIGRALIALRNAYSGPKEKLMLKVNVNGAAQYRMKEAPAAAFPATAVQSAQKKLAGWTDMSTLPDATQMRGLLKTGAAKRVSGKSSPKRKWEVRQLWKEVKVPYSKTAAGVTFSLRQSQKIKKRTKTTAEIVLTVPYAYARQFMNNHIKSVRTRNYLIKQMENSAGYKSALGVNIGMREVEPLSEDELRKLPGPAARVG